MSGPCPTRRLQPSPDLQNVRMPPLADSPSTGSARNVIPIVPEAGDGGEGEGYQSLYEAQKKIYPRSVAGRFVNWR